MIALLLVNVVWELHSTIRVKSLWIFFSQVSNFIMQSTFLLYLLYGKEWLFVLIINGNIKPCEVEIIQSVSSLTTSEHIPKGIIPTVENTENIITTDKLSATSFFIDTLLF